MDAGVSDCLPFDNKHFQSLSLSACPQHLASQLPHLKFILPTAPTQPVTMNMGMSMPSWYDIVGLDERSNENCKGIEQSRQRIAQFLQDEHESTGLAYNRMVLCGFSQGGALSLYTGMQLPESQKLGGIVALSGYLPSAHTFTITPGLEDTPILHLHGKQDPLVSYALAEKTRTAVMGKGATNYELKSYPIPHTVTMEEIAAWQAFLARVVPPDDTCKIKVKEASEMSIKELKAAIQKAGLGRQAVGLMEKGEFVKLLEEHRNNNGGKSE